MSGGESEVGGRLKKDYTPAASAAWALHGREGKEEMNGKQKGSPAPVSLSFLF